MRSDDYRAWAREALRGHWGTAILVGFLASLLAGGLDMVSQYSDPTMEDGSGLLDFISRDVWAMFVTVTVVSLLLAVVIGGAVTLGWHDFQIKLLKRQKVGVGTLFSQMHRIWAGFCMNFMTGLFVFLWTLLLIVPGFIAAYRYAMVPYLMAEFPELRVMDAFRESKRLMAGHKWQLFCLHLSFLGWELLALFFTMGLGYLWITPYNATSTAAFYLQLTGRGTMRYEQPRIHPSVEF